MGPAFINADEDPIGQQIRLTAGSPTAGYGPWRTIVGIVGDVKQHGVDQDTPQQIFVPAVQQTRTTVFAVARTRGTVSSAAIETAIRDLDLPCLCSTTGRSNRSCGRQAASAA